MENPPSFNAFSYSVLLFMNISLFDDVSDNLTAIDFGSWLMVVGG